MDSAAWVFQALTALVAIVAIIMSYRRSAKADGEWEGSVNTRIETLEKFMDEVRSDVKKIQENITKIFERLPVKTVSGDSPLQLTDLGIKISEKIKASEWAKQTASKLIPLVKNKDPYEVQELCLNAVKEGNYISKDMDAELRSCAYDNGIHKEEVLKVLAVELRDELLNQRGA